MPRSGQPMRRSIAAVAVCVSASAGSPAFAQAADRPAAAAGEWGGDMARAEALYRDGKPQEAVRLYLAALRDPARSPRLAVHALRRLRAVSPGLPPDTAADVVRVLGHYRLTEAATLQCGRLLAGAGDEGLPDAFVEAAYTALGPARFAFVPVVPQRRSLDESAVAGRLGEVEAAYRELLSGDDPLLTAKGGSARIRTERALAELRVLLRKRIQGRDRDYRRHTAEELVPRFKRIRHAGVGLDFLTEQLRSPSIARPMIFNVAGFYCTSVQGPADRKHGLVRTALSALEAITDDTALLDACWQRFERHGGPRLALCMAVLLRQRGLEEAALVFEDKVTSWFDVFLKARHSQAWALWHVMCTYNMTAGYEEEVVAYGCRYVAKRKQDSACFMVAQALVRQGEVSRAVDWLIKGGEQPAHNGAVHTPTGSHRGSSAYLAAVVREALAHPQLAEADRTRLGEAFPIELEAAQGGADE